MFQTAQEVVQREVKNHQAGDPVLPNSHSSSTAHLDPKMVSKSPSRPESPTCVSKSTFSRISLQEVDEILGDFETFVVPEFNSKRLRTSRSRKRSFSAFFDGSAAWNDILPIGHHVDEVEVCRASASLGFGSINEMSASLNSTDWFEISRIQKSGAMCRRIRSFQFATHPESAKFSHV